MAVAPMVLSSKALFQCICEYQRGVYEDMLPFLKFGSLRHGALDDYAVQHQDQVFANVHFWMENFGPPHLDRLFKTLSSMKSILLLYSANIGACDLLETIGQTHGGGVSMNLLSNMVDLAIQANHVQVIQYLRRLGYTPKNHIKQLFNGLSDALTSSNMAMVQFLQDELAKLDQVVLHAWFEPNDVDRRRMETSLNQLVEANQVDKLTLLLAIWSTWAPASHMLFARRFCRCCALRCANWTLLTSLNDAQLSVEAQVSQDLRSAIAIPSLQAVQWLMDQRRHPVDYLDVVHASGMWKQSSDVDTSLAIFYFLNGRWLENGPTDDQVHNALSVANTNAWWAKCVRAIDLVWSKGGPPPIEELLHAAEEDSSLDAVEFTFNRLQQTLPEEKVAAIAIQGLVAAINANRVIYVDWWLHQVEFENQNMVEAVLRGIQRFYLRRDILQLVETKCQFIAPQEQNPAFTVIDETSVEFRPALLDMDLLMPNDQTTADHA
ncbi:unnamed protein product [Aphanomyces euteiches]